MLLSWWHFNSGRMLILRFRGFSSFFNMYVFKWLHVKVRFHQVIFHFRTFEKKSGKWRAINALVVTKPATAVTSTDTWVHAEWKLTADHANTPVANQKWTMKIHLMWKIAADHATLCWHRGSCSYLGDGIAAARPHSSLNRTLPAPTPRCIETPTLRWPMAAAPLAGTLNRTLPVRAE